MKNIDLLAAACELPKEEPVISPDLKNGVTDALINRIADAVIEKLSTQTTPEVIESDNDGGEEDGHIESDKMD